MRLKLLTTRPGWAGSLSKARRASLLLDLQYPDQGYKDSDSLRGREAGIIPFPGDIFLLSPDQGKIRCTRHLRGELRLIQFKELH